MQNTTTVQEKKSVKSNGYPDLYTKDSLEEELERYSRTAVNDIKFTIIIKPAIISFIALIFSFFLDLSSVPILGNITVEIAKSLFPAWQPTGEISPYSFWWLPVAIYALFVFLSFLAYNNLKLQIVRTPASETIDRIMTSANSIIDGIATALPLIGAAILLISIKLGEEVFLGLSVPFEVKSLIILALGKLFEPVLDQLGVEFQNIVNHVRDIRERYFSRIQIENSKNLLKQTSGAGVTNVPEISEKDLENYRIVLERTKTLSEEIHKNFSSVNYLLEKLNHSQNISTEKIEQLQNLANSITQASNSLGNENTVSALKSLETIVVKK